MRPAMCLMLLLVSPTLYAQIPPDPVPMERNWTEIEIVLTVAFLVFTLAIIGVEAKVILQAKKAWAPRSVVRLFGLTLIVCIAAVLVVAGYSQNQIAPVMGLLGAIAGYLLGASEQTPAAPP